MMLMLLSINAVAQCIKPTAANPYFENFEATNGNWVPGGVNTDWTWGTPNKPVIKNAASGTKCWNIGGLTGSDYNSQASWLQSPCFDLSALSKPYVSFKIFWETEKKYDGASFQYSIDNGITWVKLGSYTASLTCPEDNWFNTTGITSFSNTDGWSGNIQNSSSCAGGSGGGKGTWVTARHSLNVALGLSNVQFRFTFGAGTVCNNYDGFAVDDIRIGEAPPNDASFTYSCGNNRTVNFTPTAAACNSVYAWDFGDPASGTNNYATQKNPQHQFSAPGQYTVNLTVSNPSLPDVSFQQTITVINVAANLQKAVSCNGKSDAIMLAEVSGPPLTYSYVWNTNPIQNTASAVNVGAGSYTVTVTAPQTCTATATLTLGNPTPLAHTTVVTHPICFNANGSIKITATGGTGNLNYQWQPAVTGNNATATNLAAGNYRVVIKDQNQCTDTVRTELVNQNNLKIFLGNDTLICPGESVVLNPGVFSAYTWQNGNSGASFTVTQTGTYWVKVMNNEGCTATDTIKITVDCRDVYFPSGFTPNGDGLNEKFGPIGNIAALKNYSMKVFDRWGNTVFSTIDPYIKWDGSLGGKFIPGTYIWFANYSLPALGNLSKKGTVVLLK